MSMEEQVKTRPAPRRKSTGTKSAKKPKIQLPAVAGEQPEPQPESLASEQAEPVYVIVPAAGSGSRMNLGQNKQFLQLGRYPVIVRTLRVLDQHPSVDGFIVVAADGEVAAMRRLLVEYKLKKCLAVTAGGATRQMSVLRGLTVLESSLAGKAVGLASSLVLVHDGARCFVTQDVISRVIGGIRQYQACGAAVPVKDTIKLADQTGQVIKTLDRSLLWAMQTPQGATYRLLRAAYDLAVRKNWQATDDLSILEMAGLQVHLVTGDACNIKLTTPEDRLLGEQLAVLADQAEQGSEYKD
jgi:2-C-methyl-D-erythritol 4-phosphate cytidylyltransferase